MKTISSLDDLAPAEGGLQPDPVPLIDWRTDVRHEPKQERSIATRKLILDGQTEAPGYTEPRPAYLPDPTRAAAYAALKAMTEFAGAVDG